MLCSISLAPELGSRALVLSEHHRLIHDGLVEPILNDMDKRLAVNLVSRSRALKVNTGTTACTPGNDACGRGVEPGLQSRVP